MIAAISTEIIGYVASALVVLALTMRSIVRLRIISLCGSVTFLVYGWMIGSVPIIITNTSIAAINLWFLRREFLVRPSDRGDLGVSHIRPDSPFLVDFIEYHADDIGRFQPGFFMPPTDGVMSLLLTRDGLPAGVLIGRRQGETLVIDLDYVLREHRDSRLGKWLFGHGSSVFRDAGLRRLVADPGAADHERYLRSVGFAPSSDDGTAYELVL